MVDEEEDENVDDDGDLSGKLKDLDFRYASADTFMIGDLNSWPVPHALARSLQLLITLYSFSSSTLLASPMRRDSLIRSLDLSLPIMISFYSSFRHSC